MNNIQRDNKSKTTVVASEHFCAPLVNERSFLASNVSGFFLFKLIFKGFRLTYCAYSLIRRYMRRKRRLSFHALFVKVKQYVLLDGTNNYSFAALVFTSVHCTHYNFNPTYPSFPVNMRVMQIFCSSFF